MKDSHKTILTIIAGLLVLALLFRSLALAIVAALLAISSLIHPPIADKIAWYWMKFSHILGDANSKIILTIVYFVILVPVAIAYQILNRSQKRYFFSNENSSTFLSSDEKYDKSSFEKMW
ncbi:MAG: hypothetical protein HQK54_00240 [Oligoflexales bacterium]|nr:hypothetical protein [Oligoflexales bacterium]